MSRSNRPPTGFARHGVVWALAWAVGMQGALAAAPAGDDDLARLLDVEIEGASRYAQSTLDAPAVVRVFQGSDAERLGHETVGDLLQRLPGVYLGTNRSYSSFGLRGFNRAGDYNSRTLMTIDGLRVNDAVFDQALPGYEFPVPADWVKRTELVYGPAASVYGSNALLGVANFAMLDGADAPGMTVRTNAGSFGRARIAASYGLAEPGVDLFLGAAVFRERGEDLSLPEMASPAAPDGVARGLDGTRYRSVFAKLRAGSWRATVIDQRRDKDVATGEWETSFGAPGTHYLDAYRFAELGWEGRHDTALHPSARLAFGQYAYVGHYRYDAGTPDDLTNIDDLHANWLDGEAKVQWRGWTNHDIVAGVDWRRVLHAHLLNYDLAPPATYLDRRIGNWRAGLYLQDQWRLNERWALTGGLRADRWEAGATPEISPRLAVVYRPDADDAWKMNLGRAFRAPNIAERYYDDGTSQTTNPALGVEHITTIELGWEHALASGVRIAASVYRYELGHMIDFVLPAEAEVGHYQNVGRGNTDGLDLDIEQAGGGWRWRASATFTRSTIDGQPASNSPRWLLKGHALAPLGSSVWLGAEANAVGRRSAGTEVPAYLVANAVLRYEPSPRNALALRITNLTDTAAYEVTTPGLSLDRIPRPRRALSLDWTVAF